MPAKAPCYRYPDAIVETDWLATNLEDPTLRIFDCTTHLIYNPEGSSDPYTVKSGREDYECGHIPGANFLDLQGELSVQSSPYRFTLPSTDQFAGVMSRHGVGDDVRVVLYSTGNAQWATRIWWMMRAFGFDNAAVLNGGWQKWQADGHAVSTALSSYPATTFEAKPRANLFVGKEAVLAAIDDSGTCTINALGEALHSGEDNRYGRPGHIPGSVNIPAASLLEPQTNKFLEPSAAAKHFEDVGTNKAERVITYCGGGIAATLDAFLLHQLGYQNIAVYDDSMSEWAKDTSLPIETG